MNRAKAADQSRERVLNDDELRVIWRHGGLSPGAPKGNKNAFKHGRYTAEAHASQRELAALLRSMRVLASPCEND